ncbi:hypothetical protein Tco_0596987 [Tanacetum coccineum]
MQSARAETPDPDWNTVKSVNDAPEQSWFKEMIKAEKPPLTFDELMSTPIDFNAFAMNRLKLDTITRADLGSEVSYGSHTNKAFSDLRLFFKVLGLAMVGSTL